MAPYTFDSGYDLPEDGGPDIRSDFRVMSGWRWMNQAELQDLNAAAQKSYVLRPFYAHRGALDVILTPEDGALEVATALMQRSIPFPHEMIPYPRGSQGSRAMVMAMNRVLPVVVSRFVSVGTAAIVDTGHPLPAVDLLPEPMRWETPLRVGRMRVVPGRRRVFGRPRNLPSGAPLKPVALPGPDRDYFAPLARNPAEAAAALSPALLKLTRELKVAWWSEGTMLFVWTHAAQPFAERVRLAERAQTIHRHLVG